MLVDVQHKIDTVVDICRKARDILFITGAGISADSGLPTYRGVGGLYNEDCTEEGLPIEMVLSGEMISTKPEVTWKYISRIEEHCRLATFNLGHKIIAEFEKRFHRVWVLTQNIDGFHGDAGSKNVIEIHGNVHRIICPYCGWDKKVKDYRGLEIPPKCPDCAEIARPDVIFFGEMLGANKVQRLYQECQKGFDATFSVGTTSVFPYIKDPMILAKQRGRATIEINPGSTEISDLVDIQIPCHAASALEQIWVKLN